jgi:nitrate/TMAO reductase-like tetraheme cytochrome c subunit
MDSLILKVGFAALAGFCLTDVRAATAMECNVCHSKNPAMVKMHKATKEKGINCFDCHKLGEKLMGKSQPKDRDSLLKRRVVDEACKGCHQ